MPQKVLRGPVQLDEEAASIVRNIPNYDYVGSLLKDYEFPVGNLYRFLQR